MDVVIEIDTKTIYDEVYAVTSHTGRAAGNIDAISLSEDEIKIIDSFMKESASELSDAISTYGTISFDSNSININFILPSNWKEDAKPTLTQCLKNYISNSICQRWFAMTNREDVKYYADKVIVNATNITKLLCERKKPVR